MPRRRASAIAAVAVLAVFVGSCSPHADQHRSTLEVFVPYLGADAESFAASVAPFEDATGVDVQIVGSGSFAGDIQDRVISADTPDVAVFPQPSLLLSFAEKGIIVPLPDILQPDTPDDTLHTITDIGGILHGIWFRAAVKSLVWYRPSEFTERGYTPPHTWDELTVLTEMMIADGVAPWCLGMRSFGSTGWVGTDWIEDIILRLDGAAVYDSWVTGELPFESPEVRNAFATFGSVVHTKGSVFGGPRRVLTESWQTAADPMFADPVGCMMQRQASFWAPDLPPGSVFGEDFSVFVLPGQSAGNHPIVASGDIAGAFTDSPEAAAFMEFLAQPESGEGWAALGGFTSPHATFDPEAYATELDREVGQILTTATVVRFDGSDLMPPEVGTGTFWDGMRTFVANGDLSTTLTVIDDSWPDG